MMLDVLDKCLIRNTDGGVKKFFDIDHSSCFGKESVKEKGEGGSNEKFEEGTVVGVDKVKSDTYRVQFLLKTGFIQLVKEVPSRLPFLIPDKGWAVCTPTKLHNRVSRLQVRDKIVFKVDGDMPQSRGSLKQRLDSAMFDDSDFKTSNLLFPPLPQITREADTTSSTNTASSTSTAKDRREIKGKLMSHIVSSTVTTSKEREELVMSSKMKRSIPGDFRSSVEAGRTGKHGLTDPNDSTVSQSSNMSHTEHVPNVTIIRRSQIPQSLVTPLVTPSLVTPSLVTPYNTSYPVTTPPHSSGECDVTSTHITPVHSIDQSHPPIQNIDQSQPPIQSIDQLRTPIRNIDHSQWYLSRYAASLDATPTNLHTPTNMHTPTSSFLNRTDVDRTPVNFAEVPTPTQDDLVHTTILHTPIRRRVISKPAVSTVTVSKTVSIPVSTEREGERREEGVDTESELGLTISISTESINVTDD
ncbi:mucin-17-like [Bolinopsis microptera]|uniref:mucin-17-like n=1 Tax=Bolinopsis microptera TaxID=2820187 RepID=UPI003079567C